ncbi:MAG TPA: hypothetical protein DG754_02385 [Bacteroidales bacterium]|nr:hypothetical protein [Bacteroidales bacterium]
MANQAFKQNDNSVDPAPLYWVYILYNNISKELNIGLSFNLSKQSSNFDITEKLVYNRSFSSPFNALAHKRLLESLSIQSIMHNIKQANPTLSNLTSEIINYKSNI